MKISADKKTEEAYDLMLDGDFRGSAKLFEAILMDQPDSIHILMELANVYYILGNMAKSIMYYEMALTIKPASPYLLYKMGVALYRSTHFTRASEVFIKIVESGKYLPMTYLWLGLSYYHLGKEEKSIACYRKLLSYCPETVMANYYMGVALKANGKYDEAIKHFEKLLNQADQHVSALYHIGRAYMKNFNYEKARVYFKQALELDPDNKNASEMYDFLTNS